MSENYGGMPSLDSMNFGGQQQNNGKTFSGGQKGGNRPGGSRNLNFDMKTLIMGAVIVVLLLILIISSIVRGAPERKAEKAFERCLEASCEPDADWEKMYPDEIAKQMENQMLNIWDNMDKSVQKEYQEKLREELEKMEIIPVGRVKGKECQEWLEEMVLDFAKEIDVDLSKKNIKVSEGYIVLTSEEDSMIPAILIKVNGRYGVYGFGDEFE